VVTEGTDKGSAEGLENCKQVFEAPVTELKLEKKLDSLFALTSVKAQLRKVAHWVEIQRKRTEAALHSGAEEDSQLGLKPLVFIFRGPVGVGKTTVAKILTHLLKDLDVVSRGQLIETSKKELTG
jgi:stage V sporulation protein K